MPMTVGKKTCIIAVVEGKCRMWRAFERDAAIALNAMRLSAD
jgi:hypothetical protein